MESENHPRGTGLADHWKIFIGLAIGALAGLVCNVFVPDGVTKLISYYAESVGQLFLRLIFMVVVPLVFCALTLGVAAIGDTRKLGRMGMRTLMMTLLFSSCSVLIGFRMQKLGELASLSRSFYKSGSPKVPYTFKTALRHFGVIF